MSFHFATSKPDSCTHIAGECPHHEALRINHHNVACQLVHAAIRTTAKGGRALHNAPDLVLVAPDTGFQSHMSEDTLESQASTPGDEFTDSRVVDTQFDWLAPLPTTEDIHRRRHTDVSQDFKYYLRDLSAADGDAECTTAPRRIPTSVLSLDETHELFSAGHGTAPALIYARGVPDSPSSDPTSFNNTQCILILVEIG